ncbi:MAG TPA: sulfatase [Fimbriimonadaceae bacterium]|nr:sulfatase [Fimbriimonadaceae bacterium]
MIFSDDHARQAISAYGSPFLSTPAIDRLAKEGIRFDRHYTANPLCAPSRATLLTGKSSHINGHRDNASTFDGGQDTFPKRLQAAGYETAVIGKWHLASEPTGFDHWEVLPGQGAYYNPEFLTQQGRRTDPGYVTEIITKKAMDWIEGRRNKPFFLLVGQKAPHRNWVPGPRHMSLFSDRKYPEPATLRTDYSSLTSAAKTVQMRLDTHMRPASDLHVDYVPPRMNEDQQAAWKSALAPQDVAYKAQLQNSNDLLGTNYQRYLRNYLRCIVSIDEGVGQLYDLLKARDMLKNTVIIYASDQGFFLGENAWYDKRWFYEPSAGTPFIIRPAGAAAKPREIHSVTSNLDYAPTILELAGLSVPSEMQGSSLAAVVHGQSSTSSGKTAYGHFYESEDADHKAPKYVALATERHKIIYYYDLGEWELFDLRSDSYETKNLWKTGSASTVRHEMIRKLLAKMKELKEEPALIEVVRRAAS